MNYTVEKITEDPIDSHECLPNIQAYFASIDNVESDDDCEINDDDEIVQDDNDLFNFTWPERVSPTERLPNATDFNCSFSSTPFMTKEESAVVNACHDPNLKKLLTYNRLANAKLVGVSNFLTAKLREIGILVEEYRRQRADMSHMSIGLHRPYFKRNASKPENNTDCDRIDALRKAVKITERVSRRGDKWTIEEERNLVRSVGLYYYAHLKERYLAEEKQFEERNDQEQAAVVRAKLNNLQSVTCDLPFPPHNEDDCINWTMLARKEMKGERTAQEYRTFWNTYLHPSINKGVWTRDEDLDIFRLGKEHNYQNWEAIAAELGTNRSGFILFIHYSTSLSDSFRRARFTPEEDDRIIELVNKYRVGQYVPWPLVGGAFNDRSKFQIYHRYIHYLSCGEIYRLGAFSPAEDILITLYVRKHGLNYRDLIRRYLPQRSIMQLRSHYGCYLAQDEIEVGQYSVEDDVMIMRHVAKHGERNWSVVSDQIKRTRNQVRQRYNTVKKFLEANPDKTVVDAPRKDRRCNNALRNERDKIVACVTEQLERDFVVRVPTLKIIEKYIKEYKNGAYKKWAKWRRGPYLKHKQKSWSDTQLLQFFQIKCNGQRHRKIYDSDYTQHGGSLKFFLNMLKVAIDNRVVTQSCLEDNLTETDQLIIKCLTVDEKPVDTTAEISEFVPPNIWTLLGMRGLTIAVEQLRSYDRDYLDEVKRTGVVDELLLWNDPDDSPEDRQRFFNRFVSLFTWPIVLSNCRANDELIAIEANHNKLAESERLAEVELTKRPAGRPKKKLSAKVLKMNAARRKRPIEKDEQPGTSQDSGNASPPKASTSKKRKN